MGATITIGLCHPFAICLYRSSERAKVADAASVKGETSHEKVSGDRKNSWEMHAHSVFVSQDYNCPTHTYICDICVCLLRNDIAPSACCSLLLFVTFDAIVRQLQTEFFSMKAAVTDFKITFILVRVRQCFPVGLLSKMGCLNAVQNQ